MLYVNKGVGFGWRLRYNVRPEVAVLTLRPMPAEAAAAAPSPTAYHPPGRWRGKRFRSASGVCRVFATAVAAKL